MELFDKVKNDPEVLLLRPEAERNGLNFDKLVTDGIMRATENVVNPNHRQTVTAVALYIAGELKTCLIKNLEQKPATTRAGRWIRAIVSIFSRK